MAKKRGINFSDETERKLRDYIKAKYGERRAMTLVVEQAVNEFLKREDDRERKLRSESVNPSQNLTTNSGKG